MVKNLVKQLNINDQYRNPGFQYLCHQPQYPLYGILWPSFFSPQFRIGFESLIFCLGERRKQCFSLWRSHSVSHFFRGILLNSFASFFPPTWEREKSSRIWNYFLFLTHLGTDTVRSVTEPVRPSMMIKFHFRFGFSESRSRISRPVIRNKIDNRFSFMA